MLAKTHWVWPYPNSYIQLIIYFKHAGHYFLKFWKLIQSVLFSFQQVLYLRFINAANKVGPIIVCSENIAAVQAKSQRTARSWSFILGSLKIFPAQARLHWSGR